jgi:GT2 family glycosyltransferase/cell division protein FtsB
VIDVVIPVYGGAEQTRRCIESVLANTPAAIAEVVVIDDASPDPAITAYLEILSRERRATIVRNERNVGFVRTVNRGMERNSDRDVVLLNSDTEVANDWLARLCAAAHRASDIATVTPFSNNATICSYPFDGWSRGVPGTLGLAQLDRLFASSNAGSVAELPTAVGFCMYIRRDALRALGPFDAERFGRGYGEENDFCMRALKAGWRNVLAADVFVYHEGGVSFSGEKLELVKSATKALLDAHPDYTQRVVEFIEADPLEGLRLAVDLSRVAQGAAEAHAVLLERREERERWARRARDVEKYLAGRELHIDELHEGLANATAVVAERNAALEAKEQALGTLKADVLRLVEEMDKLREGLAYAESLAFSRERQLQDIQRSRLWRYYNFVVHRFAKH